MHLLATNKKSLVLLVSLFLSVLLAAFPVHADTRQTLRLNDTNEAPLTTPQHDGFLDIIAAEAFRRAGVKLQLIKLPAERALINANAGIEDGDLVRIKGLEKLYPNLIRVPEKLIDWEFVAYSKNSEISANWQAIRQHTVGHVTGWKIYEKLTHGAAQIVPTKTPRQLFQLLERDRIEIALYARWMGQALIKQLGFKDIHQLDPVLESREMFIYLHKQHAELVPRIAKALRDLKHEGFYARTRNKTLAPYINKK